MARLLTGSTQRLVAQDERLQDLMDGLRGKFKAVTAMMGLQVGCLPLACQPQVVGATQWHAASCTPLLLGFVGLDAVALLNLLMRAPC
jgi:hypothetical protein